ncbi:MAG: thiamine pyrophosphate-requiring protein [Candidatus Tectomicrobia bacterium]|nr:thiamine pyrophosphate-requiring protein [Candidatus Tectomicrobia bacterium]
MPRTIAKKAGSASRARASGVAQPTTVAVETTAQAYLELLRDRGVEYVFANGGTDFASIVDAFAKMATEKKETPRPITVPHEATAVSMAHGYYLATGRPQVVMVHVIVGAANASGSIMNAARARVPIIFSAGRNPLTEEGLPGCRNRPIHWAQESFDQGNLLREFTKWDYELRSSLQLQSVVDRALAIAMQEPRGPVYLTLPREVLAERLHGFTLTPFRQQTNGLLYPDPDCIAEAAKLLAKAKNPLVIAQAIGRDPAAVPQLVELAELFGLPVVEMHRYTMNFPTTHPLHLGFDPDPFLDEADVILVLDADVPWFPCVKKPKESARVIQLGVDPLFSRYPIRGFPVDVPLQCDGRVGLQALVAELRRYAPGAARAIEARAKRLRAEHDRQRATWAAAVRKVAKDAPLDFAWVGHCINEVKQEQDIVVNEYDLMPTVAEFTAPGTYFGLSPSGGLGWGLGAALGIKLALPERTVIAAVGDGSYMFNNPTPAHFVARAQNLPILVVIFNNQCWRAVKNAHLSVHPDGWPSASNNFPLCNLDPSPDYEKIVGAHGGYGERVETPDQVIPALRRGLRAVQEEGRQAVLHMVCKHA